jgi:site-specific DNA recombinase
MKQAIGYIRVSTEKQASEGVSLEAQKARICAWCAVNGYELKEENIFIDPAITGAGQKVRGRSSFEKTLGKRPKLKAALNAVGKGDVLVSYSLSRLVRSTNDAIALGEMVAIKKADMVSLTEQIDTTTAAGKMMFQMLSVLAEFERNLVAERTTNALQHKKRSGQKYTNQTPYGFEAIEGRLVEVKQEAEVVAEIQAARSSGSTLQAIANNLNGRGIPTKTGKTWAPATIHLLLKRSSLVAAL